MKEIYSLAKIAGACSPGLRDIQKAKSVFDLIRLLKTGKGIEFIMESNFLTNELFDKYRVELEKENIFVDGNHTLDNPRLVILLGGQVDIKFNGFQVCDIYAKGSAKVNVVAHDYAFVSVTTYQQAELKSEQYDKSKVKEYRNEL